MAENSRLTDLTRMLLESPAFSSFLNEMSGVDGNNGTSSSQQLAPAPKVEDAQPQASKDVNPHSPYVQSDRSIPQIGTGLRPDTYSAFNTATTWTDNMDSGLYDAQVYAVTSMPEGPVFDQFDTGLLSGKTSSSSSPFAWFDAKQDAPVLEQPPPPREKADPQLPTSDDSGLDDAEMDESDPVFSLYDDTAPSSNTVPSENVAFSRIVAEKASERIVLTVADESVENNQVSVATMKRFWQFCATMEDLSQRVASATSHLQ